MIQSMTGYGLAEHVEDGATYSLELRSVNHRYLKLSIRLPDPWQFAESAVEKVLRGRLSRGSVTCTLRIGGDGRSVLCPINLAVLQGYVDQLAQAKAPKGVQPTIDLGSVAQLPGVTQAPAFDDEARQRQQGLLERLCGQALDSLVAMRREEGGTLRTALHDTCAGVRERMREVAVRAPLVVQEYHERLRTRVGLLMQGGGFELETEGLMREVAIYAERCDISEELTRLASHLDQFADLCNRAEPVGRTLDFLAQELLREANTIGSKSNDAAIARSIVEVKGLIDRLKEQVQNVE